MTQQELAALQALEAAKAKIPYSSQRALHHMTRWHQLIAQGIRIIYENAMTFSVAKKRAKILSLSKADTGFVTAIASPGCSIHSGPVAASPHLQQLHGFFSAIIWRDYS